MDIKARQYSRRDVYLDTPPEFDARQQRYHQALAFAFLAADDLTQTLRIDQFYVLVVHND